MAFVSPKYPTSASIPATMLRGRPPADGSARTET
jgi:hypothetical protein